jgi:hypothetical protein
MDIKVQHEKNFLSTETLEKVRKKNEELIDLFEVFFDNESMTHYKLGSYTEYRKLELNEEIYISDREKTRNFMWDNYSFLYEELKSGLTKLTGIECDYHESLFLPGVRSFINKRPITIIPYNDKKNNYHYDYNIYFMDWENEILHKKISESISYTLVIDVPEYTNFNWLSGTETKDKDVLTRFKIRNTIENVIVVPLEENDIIVQYNQQLHAMGDTKFTKPGQKRTSIQGCGLYDGEKIWLSW